MISKHNALFFVRHGRVDNPKRLVYGQLPGFPLSAEGEEDAATAAKLLSKFRISAIVSSPVERTAQTAEAIAKQHGCEVRFDWRLREVENANEGAPYAPYSLPPSNAGAISGRSSVPFLGALEQVRDIERRVCRAVVTALANTYGDIVFVSHQVPIRLFCRWIGVSPAIVPDVAEGAVVHVRRADGVWSAGMLDGPMVSFEPSTGLERLVRRFGAS